MPSVGMRRSTRVFGTRILRSGRRLWTGPHEFVRGAHGENKFPVLADGGDADDCHKDMWHENENIALTAVLETEEREPTSAMEVKNVDRMCGLVYSRRRKRAELASTDLTEDERYGKKFSRRQWRTKSRPFETLEARRNIRVFARRPREMVIVVNRSSYDCGFWITCFLTSVLGYMSRVRTGMRRLSAFLRSKPIYDAFSSCGMLFLQAPVTANNPGVRIISGSRSSMPFLSVDIFALPSFFAHMQTIMCLRSARLDCWFVAHYDKATDVAGDDAEEHPLEISSSNDHQDCSSGPAQVSPGRDASFSCDVDTPDNGTPEGSQLSNQPLGLPKSTLRNLQLRNSRNIQKRRSSLRRKRGRPPSVFRGQKASGALASDFLRIRQDGGQFSPASPSRLLRSSDKRRSTANTRELKSANSKHSASSRSCSANLLVTESDKCYRVEGVTVALETSSSKQWFLVVTKGEAKHLTLTAQQVMRPPCSNRFTHAVIWAGDGGWKLEFPDKQDWVIFKELYKECSDRNVQSPVASVIPVPCVQEVLSPVDAQYIPFVRPDTYISVKDDELIRALKKTVNYDMDSDDEEWLVKLNNELSAGSEPQELITPESFEMVIDALEKGFHCNPDEHIDEQAAYEFCMHLERREVVDAIHKYWVKKRKHKRSALVRVFQLYQPRRSQVIPKSVLRKKRSFKRVASQVGRGKQRPLLQAIAAEREALEQQNNVNKLHEAKAAADQYEGLAMLKRQKAQMLMENADLATYKAMMALRIAEAAQTGESPATVSSFFLEDTDRVER